MNCEHYDEELTTAIDASSERDRALYGSLVFLRGQQRQLLENVTRMDRHMGMLAQHITDDETFTVTGAIVVPRPTLDIANLPLHIVLPDTDPDGDRFATDDDVSPNDPAFLRKVIAHRRGLKRATEVSKGQHLLQLRQRCIGAVQTPVPSSSFSQTNSAGHADVSTSRRSPIPIAGVSSLPADQRTLLYPDPFPVVDDSRSDESDVSDASRRAGKFPDVSPPATLPAIEHDFLQNSRTPYASPLPLSQSIQTPNTPIVLVWDDEDAELDDMASPVGSMSSDRITHTTVLLDEVQEELNVLCANWESTAPSTVWTMDRRRSTRTTRRNHTGDTSTLDHNWRDDTTWDDPDYGNGEQ
uniref:Uncharacterized protein n=1 Tax=Moniliophthora roreri TaxID=221103 RepID=A0A0W0FN35_MONRR